MSRSNAGHSDEETGSGEEDLNPEDVLGDLGISLEELVARIRAAEESQGRTISPEELEDRNTHRLYINIENLEVKIADGGEMTVEDNGGLDLGNLDEEQTTRINKIITRLMKLLGLVAVILLLWRLGLLFRVLGLVG